MRRALALASRALGTTAPNPAVGCVIVGPAGSIVGEGCTQPGGRPHAEAVALAAAGGAAAGGTAYVTLEPCAHHGRTPPCADALVAAGLRRVVVACAVDPDPRVAGRGLAILRAAGVAVETGLLAAEAEAVVAGFVRRVTRGRPLVTVKLAMSMDGRIATRAGVSQWITGPLARRAVHRMRAAHDSVLVGVGTVLADDPRLTCRLPGLLDRPYRRIVLDTALRTPPDAALFADAADHSVVLVVAHDVPEARAAGFAERSGVTVARAPRGAGGSLDIDAVLRLLGDRGLTSVLVEAGGRLGAAFVRGGHLDRLVLHRAPLLIGGDGVPALASLGVDALAGAPRLCCLSRRSAGPDLLETYAVVPVAPS